MQLGPILRAMMRSKLRFGLIVIEIALTLAVVANCIAMIIDARREISRPSGFDDDHIVVVETRYFDEALRDRGRLAGALREDLALLRGLPGVRSAMNTGFLPWNGGGSSGEVRPLGSNGEMLRSQMYSTDEGLLDTLGVPLDEGRTFTRDDVERDTQRLQALLASQRERGPDGRTREPFVQEVVISRAFAKLAFGEGPHSGKMLEDSDGDHYRVIGVMSEFYNPYGWPIHEYAIFYANYATSYDFGSRILVRAEPGQAAAMAAAIEDRLGAQAGQKEVRVRLLTEIRDVYFGPQRMVASLMGLVVVLLVLVTSLGIGGLTSFSVAERTRQIGTRRALGATMADIVRYFLAESWLVTTMGLVLGAGLAVCVNMALLSVFAGAKLQAGIVAASVFLLWTVGLGAALVPALRGARTPPSIATRNV